MLLGCDAWSRSGSPVEGAVVPLNGALVVPLDGRELLEASITERSVRVLAGQRALDRRVVTRDGALEVLLVVDAALLEAPPLEVTVVLAGAPSAHALRFRDGSRLERPRSATFRLSPGLGDGLRRLAPRALAGGAFGRLVHDTGDPLEVQFDGVVDPATVGPSACPLARQAQGLGLAPVAPAVRWSIVGDQTVLHLGGLPSDEVLELRLRDWHVRDLAGRAPSPLLTAVIDT